LIFSAAGAAGASVAAGAASALVGSTTAGAAVGVVPAQAANILATTSNDKTAKIERYDLDISFFCPFKKLERSFQCDCECYGLKLFSSSPPSKMISGKYIPFWFETHVYNAYILSLTG
jgi:hypothetical protein